MEQSNNRSNVVQVIIDLFASRWPSSEGFHGEFGGFLAECVDRFFGEDGKVNLEFMEFGTLPTKRAIV